MDKFKRATGLVEGFVSVGFALLDDLDGDVHAQTEANDDHGRANNQR